MQLLQKRCFERWQQRRVDCADFPDLLLGRQPAHVQAVQDAAEILDLVLGQGLFDLGKTGISEIGKRQYLGRTHHGNADQKCKYFGHRQLCGGLDRLRVELNAATPARLSVNHEALLSDRPDVA